MEFEGGSVKPILTSEQHDSYKRDGFLVLENFFDPSELDMIMKDKRIDLNYGYSSKRNIYDENLVVKFDQFVGRMIHFDC